MKVCFPVQRDEGLESAVYDHFGSAPLFLVVDTASGAVETIHNRDQHHAQGACNPVKALAQTPVNAVVVGGIGAGALAKLAAMGLSVHRAGAATVRENLALFSSQELPEYTLQSCCGGSSSGGACAH